MRFAAILAVTIVGAFSAIWGAFALWYQAPGGHALKALSVFLWAVCSLMLLIAVWQGRTGPRTPDIRGGVHRLADLVASDYAV